MPHKVIVDCSTGETTEVELTAEEIADQESAAIAAEEAGAEKAALEAAHEASKLSAINKLKALGLTSDEAKALLA
jgi:hypothetical protein